jgi:hypothetical protein
MFRSLHHLTFVVADLDAAVARLAAMGAAHDIVREALPARGVDTVRMRVGGAWLVFVAPTGPGIPADHLARHGEAALLASFRVDSIGSAVVQLALQGIETVGEVRAAIGGWRVQDLALQLPGGIGVQICEDPGADAA